MKIAAITAYRADLLFVDGAYVMAKGKSVSVADSAVVRLDKCGSEPAWPFEPIVASADQ